jgi:hypothetical protein
MSERPDHNTHYTTIVSPAFGAFPFLIRCLYHELERTDGSHTRSMGPAIIPCVHTFLAPSDRVYDTCSNTHREM